MLAVICFMKGKKYSDEYGSSGQCWASAQLVIGFSLGHVKENILFKGYAWFGNNVNICCL